MDAGIGRAPWWRASALRVTLLAAATAAVGGCAIVATALRGEPPGVRVTSTTLTLHGTPLTLHLAHQAAATGHGLVLFASGDGGWYGRAIDMFRAIAARGYPVVGFSARTFLQIERPPHEALNPRRLALDYQAILGAAAAALEPPPAAGVILAGWSRGASFAALAGTEPGLRAQVRGVVAIGLAADESFAIDADDDDDGPGDAPTAVTGAFRPYERLRAGHAPRAAVIQAEHDEYLPAAEARSLLGLDTRHRRLYAVAARNHRFSGGEDAFDAALADALAWLDQARATTPVSQ